MKTIVGSMLVSMLMIVAAPAYSAEVVHIFYCEEDDDATEEQLEAALSNWLKAAKKMKGGDRLKAYVYYPLAVNMPGETDHLFVVVAPSIEEWGLFWDGYKNSPAEEVDNDNSELFICPDSALMESVEVK